MPYLIYSNKVGTGAPSPELIVNGTFDTDTIGWETTDALFTSVDGQGKLERTSDAATRARQGIPTEIGKTYVFHGEIISGTTNASRIFLGDGDGTGTSLYTYGFIYGSDVFQVMDMTFVANTSTTWVSLLSGYDSERVSVPGDYHLFDNFSLQELES